MTAITDHLFIDGDEVMASIDAHPRCPWCEATPGIVVWSDGTWETATTHVGDCAIAGVFDGRGTTR